mmetsp:Transcript_53923/g.143533  ORF Transcript_53923/g.143533 Transcript_53923/m.143533 type:complete len:251 (+) Transcript_53923:1241-1993(+)
MVSSSRSAPHHEHECPQRPRGVYPKTCGRFHEGVHSLVTSSVGIAAGLSGVISQAILHLPIAFKTPSSEVGCFPFCAAFGAMTFRRALAEKKISTSPELSDPPSEPSSSGVAGVSSWNSVRIQASDKASTAASAVNAGKPRGVYAPHDGAACPPSSKIRDPRGFKGVKEKLRRGFGGKDGKSRFQELAAPGSRMVLQTSRSSCRLVEESEPPTTTNTPASSRLPGTTNADPKPNRGAECWKSNVSPNMFP